MKHAFARTAGLDEAKAFLVRALESGKFPHALLIHGPEGAGQNALLLDLADILLCEAPEGAGVRPCGKCPACLQGKRGVSERAHFLLPLEKGGGDEDRKELDVHQVEEMVARTESFVGDPYGRGLSEKDLIRIVQVRDLQGRLAYAGVAGKSRVVIAPWAESFQPAAANALLKTLEEPPPGTYFLLSTSNRKAVLQTILSRCTGLPVPAMDDASFSAAAAARREWWTGEGGTGGPGVPPARLIPFAEGSLGALLSLYRNGGETLLEEAGRFIAASLSGDWREFSDYLDGSGSFEDMDGAARLMHFTLRAVRARHRLAASEGIPADAPAPGGWIPSALERQGWDASLAPLFAALDRAPDLAAYAGLAEAILQAVRDYSKPRMAALGCWLEREAALSPAPPSPAGALR